MVAAFVKAADGCTQLSEGRPIRPRKGINGLQSWSEGIIWMQHNGTVLRRCVWGSSACMSTCCADKWEVNELSSHGATLAAVEIYNPFIIYRNHKIPFPSGHLTIAQLTYCILQTALYNINADMSSAFPQIKVVDKGERPVENAVMQKV